MKYKLLATDLDGTLLNDDVVISEGNRRALEEANNKGIEIIFATGRLYVSAVRHSDELSFNMPIISSNGAIVTDASGRLIYEDILEDDLIRKVTSLMDDFNIYYHLYTMDSIYSKDVNKDLLKRYYSDGLGGLEVNTYEFDDIEEILDRNLGFTKILASDDDYKYLAKLENQLREKFNDAEITKSWIDNVEVMNKGVNKATALKEVCYDLGINTEEVIAVGDNENDLPMLRFAGKGIAMENGVELVKKEADELTSTNENDGLAKVIKKYLL